jgi:hypothetical protein
MAKKQRTIQLPEELLKLADAYEYRTGARFNRQLLAAVIHYLFSDPRGPDALAMEAAVKLENGDLPLDGLPSWLAGQRSIRAMMQCSSVSHQNPKSPDVSVLTREMHAQERTAYAWGNVGKLGPGVVDGLIRLWALSDSGIDVDPLLEALDVEAYRNATVFLGHPGQGDFSASPPARSSGPNE